MEGEKATKGERQKHKKGEIVEERGQRRQSDSSS